MAGMNSLFPIRWYDSFTELSRLAQNSSEVRESVSSSRLSLSPEPHYQLKPPRRRGHKRLCASSKEISSSAGCESGSLPSLMAFRLPRNLVFTGFGKFSDTPPLFAEILANVLELLFALGLRCRQLFALALYRP